jgi:hypothetical protein
VPYPDLDALTDPAASDPRVGHALLHRSVNDALRLGVRKATVTLSSADILDLHNTPVTLVAAPGAGKTVIPTLFIASSGAGTTLYSVIDYTGVAVGTGAGTGVTWVEELGGLTSGYSLTHVKRANTPNPLLTTDFDNGGLTVYSVDGNAFTLGDFPLTITVWYTIEDVP